METGLTTVRYPCSRATASSVWMGTSTASTSSLRRKSVAATGSGPSIRPITWPTSASASLQVPWANPWVTGSVDAPAGVDGKRDPGRVEPVVGDEVQDRVGDALRRLPLDRQAVAVVADVL